jgi:t-SNARE complex subunit (syntaxin)
MNGSTL